jgi:hypothetical protein
LTGRQQPEDFACLHVAHLHSYFYDPNGIRLEFACQPEDGAEPAIVFCITQAHAEARTELMTLPCAMAEWIEERLSALPE